MFSQKKKKKKKNVRSVISNSLRSNVLTKVLRPSFGTSKLSFAAGLRNGRPHDNTNKMECAPSEDSDQPGHPPSLIRVFAVRMKKAWVLSHLLSAQRRL